MDIAQGTMPPRRRRIASAPNGRHAWQGSAAQREWARTFENHARDCGSGDNYIFVHPRLVGLRPMPATILKHFSTRLAKIGGEPYPRRWRPYDRLSWLWHGAGTHSILGGPSTDGRPPPGGAVEHEDVARLKTCLATLRLGLAPAYCPQLAALLAARIGLHPAYVWDEALLSHEMFLTLGWLGHVLDRGGAWMPAAVAEYLADVIGVDEAGHHDIIEPLVAELVIGQDFRIAVADAADTRLRHDEAFLRWPRANLSPVAERGVASR